MWREWFRRRLRGSPAVLEFTRLQMLQRANVPAPRAVAVLVGFRLSGQLGDAVIMEAIEPSVALDEYFSGLALRGEYAANHRDISRQVRELVKQLVEAKLGHDDLHLGNFLLKEGKVYLLDGYAVRRGMRGRDIYRLAHSVRPFATLTDLKRGWDLLAAGPLPRTNPISRELRNEFLKRIGGDNRYFGRLHLEEWSGVYFRSTKFAKRWSVASTLHIEQADWEKIWPGLWEQIKNDQLRVLKSRQRGCGCYGTIAWGMHGAGGHQATLQGYWYRYLNEVPRRSRSWRGWMKGWNLIGGISRRHGRCWSSSGDDSGTSPTTSASSSASGASPCGGRTWTRCRSTIGIRCFGGSVEFCELSTQPAYPTSTRRRQTGSCGTIRKLGLSGPNRYRRGPIQTVAGPGHSTFAAKHEGPPAIHARGFAVSVFGLCPLPHAANGRSGGRGPT